MPTSRRDGVVVAFHDCRLDRVTDRRGRIRDLTIAEVEQADAGFKFPGYRGRGVRVPRLEELLMRWPDARVNIDPKEDDCVEPLVALLDRLDVWDRVCIGAFSDARLKRVRRLARGRACTSMGPIAVATAWLSARGGRMPRLGANCLQVPRSQFPFALVTSGSSTRRTTPDCRCTCGPSTIRRRCAGCSPSASTGS